MTNAIYPDRNHDNGELEVVSWDDQTRRKANGSRQDRVLVWMPRQVYFYLRAVPDILDAARRLEALNSALAGLYRQLVTEPLPEPEPVSGDERGDS